MERSTRTAAEERAARANRLYWTSSRSVARIAEELGIAKGTLYGMIDPLPASLPCPECTSEMVYANRTARDRKLLACPGCGLVEDEAVIREAWRGTARGSGAGALVVRSRPAAGTGVGAVLEPLSGGKRALLGALFLGAAAGVAAVFWMRRRS